MASNNSDNEESSPCDHHISDYFRDHNTHSTQQTHDPLLEIYGEIVAELVDQFIDMYPDRKPRVTDETIQSFTILKMEDFGDSMCNICLEEYTQKDSDEESARQLPCGHRFHLNCIKKWLDGGSTNCPTCRNELPTDDPMFEAFKKRKKEKLRMEAAITELHESMYC